MNGANKMEKSSDELQHPRRNLGQRFRAQSERFMKLASKDPERKYENLAWAEQNSRQAILHDFTDYRNWLILARTKKMLEDSNGLKLVLEDLFTVLGRDPENLTQLVDLDYLNLGEELLSATLLRDPLDPDEWWEKINEKSIDVELELFKERCKLLDFRDARANIVYGRRLERIIRDGREELFIELVQYLLSHRPTNHELWSELGRLHEKRGENDDAWLCYDKVQQLNPNNSARDKFLERISKKFKQGEEWVKPTVDARAEFDKRMEALADRLRVIQENDSGAETETSEENILDSNVSRLEELIENGDLEVAFFLSRRLLTEGESWAKDYFEQCKALLSEVDDTNE